MRTLVVVLAVCLAASAEVAHAEAPDTPPGYEFCGWRDFVNDRWTMQWSEDLAGAYMVAFSDGMTCNAARRNVMRMRSSGTPAYRPLRTGYRCVTLKSGYEYADVRCVKTGGSRKFRFQTGA